MKVESWCGDYVAIDNNCDYILNDDKMLVCLNEGDLFIWDSRIVHCSSHAIAQSPLPNRNTKNNNIDFLRTVSFVTYSPKSLVPQSKRKKFYSDRMDIWVDNMATSHWPHECVILAMPMTKQTPHLMANDANSLKNDENQVKASLIGYNEYKQYFSC